MVEVEISVEAEINPTESEEKVKAAVQNVLGNAEYTTKAEQGYTLLTAHAKGQDALFKMRNIMRSDKIRDASRRCLYKATRDNTIKFYLNKQVAWAGHISFCEQNAESPLGPIKFTIETDDAQTLVEWLAEKTEKK